MSQQTELKKQNKPNKAEDKKAKKPERKPQLYRGLFISALILGFALVGSGAAILTIRIIDKKRVYFDQIDIVSYDQSSLANPIVCSLSSGESYTAKITVKSKLKETVKYSIDFSNHELSEADKYLYVTVTNSKDDILISNTLYQIFDQNLSISNEKLEYHQKEVYNFTFTVSDGLEGSVSYDFSVGVKAKGKFIY